MPHHALPTVWRACLSPYRQHPLAAKMLAVMARLALKQGRDEEGEKLQQRVRMRAP